MLCSVLFGWVQCDLWAQLSPVCSVFFALVPSASSRDFFKIIGILFLSELGQILCGNSVLKCLASEPVEGSPQGANGELHCKKPVGISCLQTILPLEKRYSWLFLGSDLWDVGNRVEYSWSGFQHALQCLESAEIICQI